MGSCSIRRVPPGQPKGIVRNLSGRSMRDPAPIGLEAVWGYDEHTVFLNPAHVPLGAQRLQLCDTSQGRDRGRDGAVRRRGSVGRDPAVPAPLTARSSRRCSCGRCVSRRRDSIPLRPFVVEGHRACCCAVPGRSESRDDRLVGLIVHEYYGAPECNGLTIIRAPEWLERKGSSGRPLSGRCTSSTKTAPNSPSVRSARCTSRTRWPTRSRITATTPRPRRRACAPGGARWATSGMSSTTRASCIHRPTLVYDHLGRGFDIWLQEIANASSSIPQRWRDAAVFGVPDAEMGEQVKAVVQPARSRRRRSGDGRRVTNVVSRSTLGTTGVP